MSEAEEEQDSNETLESLASLEVARYEEIDSLKVIYEADSIEFKVHGPRHVIRIHHERMSVDIITLSRYPRDAPILISTKGLAPQSSAKVTGELTRMADSLRGSVMLYDLIEQARSMLESGDLELELVPSLVSNPWLITYQNNDIALRYMGGITMQQITDRLATDNVKTLHAELILNNKLIQKFEAMRTSLEVKYKTHHHRQHFLKTEIAFHGTRRESVPNIIARGFVKPGDVMNKQGDPLRVRCGSVWGRGIYVSPDPTYSIDYTDYTMQKDAKRHSGRKLFVCAVLRGRQYKCDYEVDYTEQDKPVQGFDSNTSASEWAYIFFKSAQILPLYVLHCKLESDDDLEEYLKQLEAAGPPKLLKAIDDVIEERKKTGIKEIDESDQILTRRLKQKILTDMARKHFPLGFGPATGDKFVVEEIGQVDDDEEEWGEYQLDRQVYQRKGDGIYYFSDSEEEDGDGNETKVSSKKMPDEFQPARIGRTDPRLFM
jgi:hypothetical protein